MSASITKASCCPTWGEWGCVEWGGGVGEEGVDLVIGIWKWVLITSVAKFLRASTRRGKIKGFLKSILTVILKRWLREKLVDMFNYSVGDNWTM